MPTSSNPFYADVAGAFDSATVGFQNIRKNEMDMAQLATEGPARVRHLQLQNQKLENDAKSSAELRALFSEGMADDGTSKSAQALRLGQRVGAVDPSLAFRLFSLSSDMALEEARAGKANADAAAARAKALERDAAALYSLIGEVKSPEEYEGRRMQLLSSPGLLTAPENRGLLENTPYEAYRRLPQLVELERKRAADEIAKERAKTYRKFADNGAARTEVQRQAVEARTARDARKAVDVGDKPVNGPNKLRTDEALAYLRNTPEGSGLSGATLRNAAADIAARAEQIRARSPHITLDVARVQALEQLKRAGALKKTESGWGEKWTYNSIGVAAEPSRLPSGAPQVERLPDNLAGFRADPAKVYQRGNSRYRVDPQNPNRLVKVQ
jgi:hypothetical protein